MEGYRHLHLRGLLQHPHIPNITNLFRLCQWKRYLHCLFTFYQHQCHNLQLRWHIQCQHLTVNPPMFASDVETCRFTLFNQHILCLDGISVHS
jgi:hypothetical protein